jgi:acyl-CoA synthetase (AMP-forming)/AMP-acid ligase II
MQTANYNSLEFPTLNHLLRYRAEEQPSKRGFAFMSDGEEITATLTYAELGRRARAIAAFLQNLGAQGERAILLYPPGMEFVSAFFGCLQAGVTAVPCCPPPNSFRLNRSLNRFRAIARDARPLLALTTSQMLAKSQTALENAPDLLAMKWVPTDEIGDDLAYEWTDPNVSASQLAFLQYTSGSTARPKGVMISHENILQNVAYYQYRFQQTSDSASITWLPTFHDLGIMTAIFSPLYGAFESYLMAPVAFVQRPVRWLEAITKYKLTHSSGPNFALDLCVERVTAEQRQGLDLSSWHVAAIGAEPIRRKTLERFVNAFSPCGLKPTTLMPGYGLAEATLLVSGTRPPVAHVYRTVEAAALEQHRFVEVLDPPTDGTATRTLVGCGQLAADRFNVKVVIANPATLTLCAPDEIGEIWVSSPSVAHGYWNREEDTAQTFHAYLLDTGEGPFLRTGDLGIVRDGELFITGRLKDVIIIDGRNHYPQDIEKTVEESHPALRPSCSAAFSVDVDGLESLVVVAEVARNFKPEGSHANEAGAGPDLTGKLAGKEILRAIRRTIAEEHDINIHSILLLKTGTIFKTSSGKIQRRACRQAFLDGTLAQFSWDRKTAGAS